MAVITLNCLVIPIGPFIGIPRNVANFEVIISRGAGVLTLRTQIQNWLDQLPPPYNNVVFSLRAFRPMPMDYRPVSDNMSISNYFPEEEELPQNVYHILIAR
jgi:hypothetical protein